MNLIYNNIISTINFSIPVWIVLIAFVLLIVILWLARNKLDKTIESNKQMRIMNRRLILSGEDCETSWSRVKIAKVK